MSLSSSSIVAIQQDPMSPTILTDYDTAMNVLDERIGTKSGGRRTRRRVRTMVKKSYKIRDGRKRRKRSSK